MHLLTQLRLLCAYAAAMVGAVCCATRVEAIVVLPSGLVDNASAPADDPGWRNVGSRGVYLGNRWVLTASHVGAGTTLFEGVGVFAYEAGTEVRLNNPAGQGLSAQTDLVLYRLTADPGLPALAISSSSPGVGANVTLIGDGRAVTSADVEKQWDVTGASPNLTWTEVPSGGDRRGFTSSTFLKTWGTNLVEDEDQFFGESDADNTVNINSGHGDVISFFTKFDDPSFPGGGVTKSEAQAMGADSGSGLFVKNGATWELAGIVHAIGVFEDQPGFENPALSAPPPQSAVYGNLTFAADLSQYRDQLASFVAIPEAGALPLVAAAAALAGLCRWVPQAMAAVRNRAG